MPKPIFFINKSELIDSLKKVSDECINIIKSNDNLFESIENLIKKSVVGNTFRAFQNINPRPSEIFRNWAYSSISERSFFPELCEISSQKEFDIWHASWCNSFSDQWTRISGNVMRWGQTRKLPDLLLLGLIRHWRSIQFKNDQALKLAWFANVPLDTFVLKAIRHHVLNDGFGKPTIPIQASMGWVADERTYSAIQNEIRKICAEAGVPGICLDHLAYSITHHN